MKAIKKILAAVMCFCLILSCVSVAAFAAETGTITIQSPSNSDATVAGKTFNVYKIFNATTNGTNTSYSWYVDENGSIPFYNYFYGEGGVLSESTDGNVQGAVDYVVLQDSKGSLALSQFADSLHNYIEKSNKAGTVISTYIDPVKAGDTADSVDITGLDYGYYLIYDASTLDGSAVRSAVMLTTVNKNVTVTLKANRPQITKTVKENDGSYGKGTSSNVGDTVSFRLETVIPDHSHYTNYTYKIEDTMADGLELKADTIKVYSGDTLLTAGTDSHYTLDTTGTDGKDFVISLNVKAFGDENGVFAVDKGIKVDYDATLTNVEKILKTNTNTATLTYSNDPDPQATSTGSVTDSANVYTYQFVFTKFASDSNGTLVNVRLAGAEFQLYRVNADGSEELINFTTEAVPVSDTASYTKYIVAPEKNDNTTDTLVVHNEGEATITLESLNYGGHLGDVLIFGLSEGTYKLYETKAPDGYVLPQTPFEITITDEIGELGSVGTLTVTGSHDTTDAGKIVNMNGMAEQILTVWAEITNRPGSVLPETGGIGTTIFTVAGIVLMAGALAFFTLRKRNSAV